MLQHAVNGIMELRQVNNTAGQMGTTSGPMLKYDEYTTLLLSAASAHEDPFKATAKQVLMMIIIMVMMRHLTLIFQLVQFKLMPPDFVTIRV
jgi:hypothetical protein